VISHSKRSQKPVGMVPTLDITSGSVHPALRWIDDLSRSASDPPAGCSCVLFSHGPFSILPLTHPSLLPALSVCLSAICGIRVCRVLRVVSVWSPKSPNFKTSFRSPIEEYFCVSKVSASNELVVKRLLKVGGCETMCWKTEVYLFVLLLFF